MMMAEGQKQAKILESEVEKQQLLILNIYRQLPSVWRREAGQDPGVRSGEATAAHLKYLQAAAVSVTEGNKQAKILESEAEKEQLIILNIYKQLPSVWRREAGQDPGVRRGEATADYLKYLQAAAINVAEGNKQAKILESEAEKQQLINAAQGSAQAVVAAGEARAKSIHAVALVSVSQGFCIISLVAGSLNF